MNLKQAEKRAAELRGEIERHNRLYYVEAKPEISDREYDKLFDELLQLEQQFPDLASVDSPTQRVGGKPIEGFEHVRHEQPMLSLEKAKDFRELQLFEERIRKALPGEDVEYTVEPKVDGVSVSALYEAGRLVRGATRGDGEVGDDITTNLRTIRAVPLRLDAKAPPARLEARGEAYMARTDFARFQDEQRKLGEDVQNARNATAGSLKQLDPRVVAQRPLSAVFYAVGVAEGVAFEKHSEALAWLRAAGLPIPQVFWICRSMEEALQRAEELKGREGELPYDIDGVVIKVNRFDQWRRLGVKTRHPAYAIAYKPKEWLEQTVTRIRAITVQVGRTGALTPVAELEPVFLDGSTISRATLHNADEIRRKDIRVGDTVVVEKAGKVIPAVVRVLPDRRTGRETPFEMPDRCPACGGPVVRRQMSSGAGLEVAVRCDNLQCPAQKTRWLEYFAQRGALDIEGLGGIVADKLVENGLVDDPFDLFKLTADNLANPEKDRKVKGFGKKNAEKILAAIERSRSFPLERWLYALAIPSVGETIAYEIAKHHGSIEEVASSDLLAAVLTVEEKREAARLANPLARDNKPKDEAEKARRESEYTRLKTEIAELEKKLESVSEEVGPVVARSVRDFFASERGRTVLKRMKSLGLDPRGGHAGAASVASPLAGKTVVLTGTLESLTRDEATAALRAAGATVTGSVSKKTNYVICGKDPGANKTDAAKQYGIQIVDERRLVEWLGRQPGTEEHALSKPKQKELL